MPDSQNPEHVRKLIAEFQLKGTNLIPTVTGEIVPTVLVADLTAAARAEDRPAWQGVIRPAAGAPNQNNATLSNPVGSGVVAVLEKIYVSTPAADEVELALDPGAIVLVASTWRDLRIAGAPSLGAFGNTRATQVLRADKFSTDVITPPIEVDLVLPPNSSLRVTQGAANSTMHVLFFWRERDATPAD
jgi:hypothetical protein